jgi:hypothetical protein
MERSQRSTRAAGYSIDPGEKRKEATHKFDC